MKKKSPVVLADARRQYRQAPIAAPPAGCARKPDGAREARPVAAAAGRQARRVGARRRGLVPGRAPRLEANDLKPWQKRQRRIPPRADAESVRRMEDVLDVHTRPHDPRRPRICMGELSKRVVRETRAPLLAPTGRPRRVGHEYARDGAVSPVLFCAAGRPAPGGRDRAADAHRRGPPDQGFGRRPLPAGGADRAGDGQPEHPPPRRARRGLPPAEARRLADTLRPHDTPKRGRWLNMAESELSVLGRQGPDRRVPNGPTLVKEYQRQLALSVMGYHGPRVFRFAA